MRAISVWLWSAPETLIAITLSILVSACGGSPPITGHTPSSPVDNSSSLDLKVAVVELENRNPKPDMHEIAWPFFPGILWWTENVPYVTPFAKCLVKDLREGGVFTAVDYFANWESVGDKKIHYDLILSGTLDRDLYKTRTYTYGLGFAGAMMAGLTPFVPVVSTGRDVEFTIMGFTPSSPHKVLWSYKMAFRGLDVNWLLLSSLFPNRSSEYNTFAKWDYLDKVQPDHPRKFGDQTERNKYHEQLQCPQEDLAPQFMALRHDLVNKFGANLMRRSNLAGKE